MVAVQTFIAVWFRRFVHNMTAAYACVFTAWLFVVLYVAIGAGVNQKSSLYYDPTPFWCWIGNGYLAERVTGEYVWMWLALAVSVLVYVVALSRRGQRSRQGPDDMFEPHGSERGERLFLRPILGDCLQV